LQIISTEILKRLTANCWPLMAKRWRATRKTLKND